MSKHTLSGGRGQPQQIPALSAATMQILFGLMGLSQHSQKHRKKTTVVCGNAYLQKKTGRSRRTVQYGCKDLERHRLIQRVPRHRKNGWQLCNAISIRREAWLLFGSLLQGVQRTASQENLFINKKNSEKNKREISSFSSREGKEERRRKTIPVGRSDKYRIADPHQPLSAEEREKLYRYASTTQNPALLKFQMLWERQREAAKEAEQREARRRRQ